MSNAIKFDAFVSLDEARKAIMLYGPNIAPILISEPGIGKTTQLTQIAMENNDKWRKPGDYFPTDKYTYHYLDWPTYDVSDLFYRIPDKETMTLKPFFTDLMEMDDPRPKIVMVDEWMKNPIKQMQVAGTRFILDKVLADKYLPDGSIIFGTANNVSDGVGDVVMAHGGNRVMFLYVLKPNNVQWSRWALENGMPELAAWAAMTPQAFYSYKTCHEKDLEGAMFFIPGRGMVTFGSPRSYAKCHTIIRNSVVAGDNLTRAALYGTVGPAAGESILAFLALRDDLHSYDDIRANPETTPVPEKFAALMMMTFFCLDRIETQDDLSAVIQYLDRANSSELMSLFFAMTAKTSKLTKLARNNKRFQSWMMTNKNHELLGKL